MRRQEVQEILRSSAEKSSYERTESHQLIICPHISQNKLPTSFTELQISWIKLEQFQRTEKQDKSALDQGYKLVWTDIRPAPNSERSEMSCLGWSEGWFGGERKWGVEF